MVPSVGNDELASWARRLAADNTSAARSPEGAAGGVSPGAGMDGADLVDRAQLLEHLCAAIAAEQARTAAAFADLCHAQEDGQARRDPAEQRARARSAAAQIALARKAAPARGTRIVELSGILVHDLPHTLARLAEGTLTEARAFAVATAVRTLQTDQRAEVDRLLCSDRARVAHLGDRALEDEVRTLVERIDAGAAAERIRRAEADRHVSLRRLPDAMAKLTAILPVAAAMAVREALTTAAEAAKAAGDPRALAQLAADALVERTTGLTDAGRIPLRIGLVMTERTLLAADAEPATLPGYGTVPADWARELVARALGDPSTAHGRLPVKDREQVWLERLFTAPGTGQLVAMDSKARLFPPSMARFLRLRDHTCRTPYCDAPTRHLDHVTRAADGGPTDTANGQCLCQACNLTKEAPGWTHTVTDGGPTDTQQLHIDIAPPRPIRRADAAPPRRAAPTRPTRTTFTLRGTRHTVETRTPTGHTYQSTPPRQPGSPGP